MIFLHSWILHRKLENHELSIEAKQEILTLKDKD